MLDRGDDHSADKLVKVPVWAWHGDADNAVPVERSRKMIAAIKAAGGDPKYTELKGVGHDSWTKAYTDPEGLLPWSTTGVGIDSRGNFWVLQRAVPGQPQLFQFGPDGKLKHAVPNSVITDICPMAMLIARMPWNK